MRTDKTRASRYQDTLSCRRREQLDGREARKCSVRDRLGIGVINGFRLISGIALNESRMIHLLLRIEIRYGDLACGHNVMGAKIEGAKDIDPNLTIKAEALEPNSLDFLAIFV